MHPRTDVQEQGDFGQQVEDGGPVCQELDGGLGILASSFARLQLQVREYVMGCSCISLCINLSLTRIGDIVQLALDDERSILYALTKSSKIMSFSLEAEDNLSSIQTIDNPVGMANTAIGGYAPSYQNNVSVVSLSVIPRKESSTYRLMAILSSGEWLRSHGRIISDNKLSFRCQDLVQASVFVRRRESKYHVWPCAIWTHDWWLSVREPNAVACPTGAPDSWQIH